MTTISRYGPVALLITAHASRPSALAHRVSSFGLVGVIEVVPGAESVTLIFDDPTNCTTASDVLDDLLIRRRDDRGSICEPGSPEPTRDPLEIPCVFDGPDLDHVADRCGVTSADVIAAFTDTEFDVAFCGFSPGFAYLDGLPDHLHLPRRERPRPRVERGSIAIASRYAAVYPSASPGGWHLIGTTPAQVWIAERDNPAVLVPGTRVRFVVRGVDNP
jgi:KipI family sensor histidine kinase inhibitor